MPRKTRPGEAAGVGDRVLLRVEETDDDDGIRHRGRVIHIIDHPKQRVLGIFRKTPHGGGRLEPVDKKMLGKELAIPPAQRPTREDGDLVAVETSPHAAARPAATAASSSGSARSKASARSA